ncbi:hypothetical protein Bbelb_193490 [Branchiostoma belcheri]|nr:hypothetical protein Bbelb_193490 [Branchiostoma belcheri]
MRAETPSLHGYSRMISQDGHNRTDADYDHLDGQRRVKERTFSPHLRQTSLASYIKMSSNRDKKTMKGVSHEKELSHGGSLGIGPSIINSFPGQSASPSMISFPGSSTSVVPYCDLGVVLHKSLQRHREFLKALRKVRHVRWNMETPDIWGTLDERPVCFLVETHWVYT